MIRSWAVLTFILTFNAYAQETMSTDTQMLSTATSTTVAPEELTETQTYNNATEFGVMVSSINSGSQFTSLGLLHKFAGDWEIGVRGLLPMNLEREAQVYQGHAFLRYDFINQKNVLFLEGSIYQGLYSRLGNELFAGFGGTYGFRRNFTRELNAGINLGADYSSSRISRDTIASSVGAFYTRMTVSGGYNF